MSGAMATQTKWPLLKGREGNEQLLHLGACTVVKGEVFGEDAGETAAYGRREACEDEGVDQADNKFPQLFPRAA